MTWYGPLHSTDDTYQLQVDRSEWTQDQAELWCDMLERNPADLNPGLLERERCWRRRRLTELSNFSTELRNKLSEVSDLAAVR
ncbi:hypothetical protein E2C01_044035 [Portunus trituberculatus]|uniref:Uncharacterized protein n=1 Tax=Portunus trituberculatus TaxID=210409 RepID=A0A5B7FUH8_PORTR|nr:hypothetical protein [Portunus trituberculatus]